jgi:glycosyltransferase involved in cell wall biosynthesis
MTDRTSPNDLLVSENARAGDQPGAAGTGASTKSRAAPTISAVITTLNEEDNIGNAIRSVRTWVDEIIVMDMYSDDDTVRIAESLGAKVFQFPRVINFDAARVAAVEKASGDWILLLDADEVIPVQLSRELLRRRGENKADVYRIPRLNYFSGRPLNGAGWAPEQDRQVRFYRRGTVTLNDVLHAHIEPNPGARIANTSFSSNCCIVHFNYRDSAQFVSKLNKYTSLTAFQRKDSSRRRDKSIVWVPLAEFLRRYLWLRGYRSGWRGFYYSFMMAAYRMTQAVKIREIQMGCDNDLSASQYQEAAARILSGYQARH